MARNWNFCYKWLTHHPLLFFVTPWATQCLLQTGDPHHHHCSRNIFCAPSISLYVNKCVLCKWVSVFGFLVNKDVFLSNIPMNNANWDSQQAYQGSKLCQVLHAEVLNEEYRESGVTVYSVNPGELLLKQELILFVCLSF